jgi:hypothetical protein
VIHWFEFPSAGFFAAVILGGIIGRSTPARALNQMTNVQKATDSGTPVNPTWDSGMEAGGTIGPALSSTFSSVMKSSSRAFGGLNFKSTGAGARGEGLCSASSLLAHGHDESSSQQLEAAQCDAGFVAKDGCTRANWIARPKISPMIVRIPLT